MEKSYQEILKILKMVGKSSEGFAFRGSKNFLSDYEHPYQSDAARNLIKLAMDSDDDPLYVVTTGAITNVASALLIEPKIINHIV